jgi:hypothetical protein
MRTGLLRIRQESIGLVAHSVTMGKGFTFKKRREETVCGTAPMPHTQQLGKQQEDFKGV